MTNAPRKVMLIEREASHFRRLHDEWLVVLEEVRRLEGFRDFLRLSTLLSAGTKAPVVISASKATCDSLILNSISALHASLALTFADMIRLVKLIKTATAPGSRDPLRSESTHVLVEDALQQMTLFPNNLPLLKQTPERGTRTRVCWSDLISQDVLAILWETVIKPVIHLLELEVRLLSS